MNQIVFALEKIARDLSALKAPFAIIGGLAVSARTEPRFTRDVDLAVAVRDNTRAEQIVRELTARGYRILAIVEQEARDRLATVRLTPFSKSEQGIVVDLLFASSGIEEEIVQTAEQIEIIEGLTMPLAVTGHLIALKVLARDDLLRPQDAADLKKLLDAATDADLDVAREALDEIGRRGFNRNRDLQAQFEDELRALSLSRSRG